MDSYWHLLRSLQRVPGTAERCAVVQGFLQNGKTAPSASIRCYKQYALDN